jgi:hypothetical protein
MYDPGRGHYHRWVVSYCTGGDWKQAHGDTEAEALVAALEAAGTQGRMGDAPTLAAARARALAALRGIEPW